MVPSVMRLSTQTSPSGWRIALALGVQLLLFLLWALGIGVVWSITWALLGLPDLGFQALLMLNGVFTLVMAWGSVAPVLRWILHWSWQALGWEGLAWRKVARGAAEAGLVWLVITGLLLATKRVTWSAGTTTWRLFSMEMVSLLAGALAEEMVFRGLWLGALAARWPFWVAAGLSSGVFALFHVGNPAWSLRAALGIFIAGMVLALARDRTDGLAWPTGFHWGWNVFQGLVWGFPVSGLGFHGLLRAHLQGPDWWTGGAFGPEAGLVSWAVLVSFAYIRFRHPVCAPMQDV